MSNAARALVSSELVLARYRPLRPLGSGGSGSVWLARDEQNGLDVALKIVPREGKAASRPEREAEAAARLRPPSCPRAYRFGRDSRHVYIAFEYVPGRTFRGAPPGGAVGVMLWEALAGRHPFWRSSLLETARAIEEGAPRLETMRPDLPRPLLAAVDRALDLDPARRPDAAALAGVLRLSGRKRRRQRGSGPSFVMPAVVPRLAPALPAALVAGWSAWAIPFYPGGWPLGLAVLAAGAALLHPRFGLAFALAVPVFPLGNLALGAAVLYAVAAIVLLILAWPEPRTGLPFFLRPLLAPIAALGLFPLAVVAVR